MGEFPMATEIGVLFDIDELGGGFYGKAAWDIFMKALNPTKISGCLLISGDTPIPGSRSPYSHCIGIEPTIPEQSGYFRNSLGILIHKGLFPPEQRFIIGQLSDRYALGLDGHIDPDGRFVMADTDSLWLFSVAAEAGWKYLPSDKWLGKFAAEFLMRTRPDDPLGALSWAKDERFVAVASQALKEAGRMKTLQAIQNYLSISNDKELSRVYHERLHYLEKIWLLP
jgi:hypothetical protein